MDDDLSGKLEGKYGKPPVLLKAAVDSVIADIQKRYVTAGNVPLGAQMLLDAANLPPAKVSWRDHLRSWVRSYIGGVGEAKLPSYARPHRRSFFGDGGVCLPGMFPEHPEVVVLVDTSGSMRQDLLRACLAELAELISSLHLQEVILACADTQIHSWETVQFEDLVTGQGVTLKGGGGTCFSGPIQEVEKRGGCGVLVYLTDGYGTFPDKPPPFPVLWAVFSDAPMPPREVVVRIQP